MKRPPLTGLALQGLNAMAKYAHFALMIEKFPSKDKRALLSAIKYIAAIEKFHFESVNK